MQLPFAAPSLKTLQTRIQRGFAPVARLRLTVVGKSGARHTFILHTYTPFFEPTPRHYFTPCGRFIVLRHGAEIDGETIRAGEQYTVYYRGEAIPDDRYALRTTIKPRRRPRAAHKQTLGRLPE